MRVFFSSLFFFYFEERNTDFIGFASQVHKLLNDPNFQQTQPGVDKNVGIFKEIQAIRDCLDEAIYQGKQ